MSPVGPQLPPELQKRKREDDDEDDDDNNGSVSSSSSSSSPSSSTGPQPAAASPPPPKRSRVIGPSLPPAPLDERPTSPPSRRPESDSNSNSDSDSDSSDDDDDDFGPSLPSTKSSQPSHNPSTTTGPHLPGSSSSFSTATTTAAPAKRDEWMTLAPQGGDWSQRVDPTKLKSRKFQTGRGAKGPSQPAAAGGGDSWHETPEEKLERLRREAMGIVDAPGKHAGKGASGGRSRDDEDTARRLREYNEKARGPALYDSHQKTKTLEDDDPSARAFDREKDIGGGLQLNSTQRRDMVKKATDFSSRFSSARYL